MSYLDEAKGIDLGDGTAPKERTYSENLRYIRGADIANNGNDDFSADESHQVVEMLQEVEAHCSPEERKVLTPARELVEKAHSDVFKVR